MNIMKGGKGLWVQLDHDKYKWPIFDENGDRIIVSHKEYMEFMFPKEYDEEIIRRKELGYTKSLTRSLELMNEVLEEIYKNKE